MGYYIVTIPSSDGSGLKPRPGSDASFLATGHFEKGPDLIQAWGQLFEKDLENSKEPKNPSPIWSHIFIAQPITTTYPNNLLGKLSQIGADVSAILASLQKRGEDKPDTCLYWYYMDHICKWGMIYEIFLGGITRERNIRNIFGIIEVTLNMALNKP